MIETIRTVYHYTLNKDKINNLYNVSNNINGDVSYWFDKEQADMLILLTDGGFVRECESLIIESQYM